MRLALSPKGLERLLHVDTNGKEAQARAWEARKRVLRGLSTGARRTGAGREAAASFLAGMESPPSQGGVPHW